MHIFKHLTALYDARSEPESLHKLGDLYWRAILSVGAIGVLCIFAYGTQTIYQTLDALNANAAGQQPKSTTPVLDRTKIQSMLDGFAARQARFDALRSATSSAAIPNIEPAK